MPHVLVLNPNTRESLTHQLVQQVKALCDSVAPNEAMSVLEVHGLTARHGADYIDSESSYVVGARAALDAWHLREAQERPSAILVACFGDPGVWALREATGLPVMGLAEAAMQEAATFGPFGIVTGGRAWEPILMRLARSLQYSGHTGLVAVHTVEASGGDLLKQPDASCDALAQACVELLQAHPEVRCVILGGAALGGWLPAVRSRLAARCAKGDLAAVPDLVDSVEAGARWLVHVQRHSGKA